MGRNGRLKEATTHRCQWVRMGHEMTSRNLTVHRWRQTVVNKYVELFEIKDLTSEPASNKSVRRSKFRAQELWCLVINCGNGWTRSSPFALRPGAGRWQPGPESFAPGSLTLSTQIALRGGVAVGGVESKSSLFCWKWVNFSGEDKTKANAAHEHPWI